MEELIIEFLKSNRNRYAQEKYLMDLVTEGELIDTEKLYKLEIFKYISEDFKFYFILEDYFNTNSFKNYIFNYANAKVLSSNLESLSNYNLNEHDIEILYPKIIPYIQKKLEKGEESSFCSFIQSLESLNIELKKDYYYLFNEVDEIEFNEFYSDYNKIPKNLIEWLSKNGKEGILNRSLRTLIQLNTPIDILKNTFNNKVITDFTSYPFGYNKDLDKIVVNNLNLEDAQWYLTNLALKVDKSSFKLFCESYPHFNEIQLDNLLKTGDSLKIIDIFQEMNLKVDPLKYPNIYNNYLGFNLEKFKKEQSFYVKLIIEDLNFSKKIKYLKINNLINNGITLKDFNPKSQEIIKKEILSIFPKYFYENKDELGVIYNTDDSFTFFNNRDGQIIKKFLDLDIKEIIYKDTKENINIHNLLVYMKSRNIDEISLNDLRDSGYFKYKEIIDIFNKKSKNKILKIKDLYNIQESGKELKSEDNSLINFKELIEKSKAKILNYTSEHQLLFQGEKNHVFLLIYPFDKLPKQSYYKSHFEQDNYLILGWVRYTLMEDISEGKLKGVWVDEIQTDKKEKDNNQFIPIKKPEILYEILKKFIRYARSKGLKEIYIPNPNLAGKGYHRPVIKDPYSTVPKKLNFKEIELSNFHPSVDGKKIWKLGSTESFIKSIKGKPTSVQYELVKNSKEDKNDLYKNEIYKYINQDFPSTDKVLLKIFNAKSYAEYISKYVSKQNILDHTENALELFGNYNRESFKPIYNKLIEFVEQGGNLQKVLNILSQIHYHLEEKDFKYLNISNLDLSDFTYDIDFFNEILEWLNENGDIGILDKGSNNTNLLMTYGNPDIVAELYTNAIITNYQSYPFGKNKIIDKIILDSLSEGSKVEDYIESLILFNSTSEPFLKFYQTYPRINNVSFTNVFNNIYDYRPNKLKYLVSLIQNLNLEVDLQELDKGFLIYFSTQDNFIKDNQETILKEILSEISLKKYYKPIFTQSLVDRGFTIDRFDLTIQENIKNSLINKYPDIFKIDSNNDNFSVNTNTEKWFYFKNSKTGKTYLDFLNIKYTEDSNTFVENKENINVFNLKTYILNRGQTSITLKELRDSGFFKFPEIVEIFNKFSKNKILHLSDIPKKNEDLSKPIGPSKLVDFKYLLDHSKVKTFRYSSDAQVLFKDRPNFVFLLGYPKSELPDNILQRYNSHFDQENYFILGWARYTLFDNKIWVDEIQTDLKSTDGMFLPIKQIEIQYEILKKFIKFSKSKGMKEIYIPNSHLASEGYKRIVKIRDTYESLPKKLNFKKVEIKNFHPLVDGEKIWKLGNKKQASSELYVGGGIARNKLIQQYSKLSKEHYTVLDKDYILISEGDIDFDTREIIDDFEIKSSVEDYFESRDITLNQCLYSESTGQLIASVEAMKDAQAHIVRQVEDNERAALRAIRFAAILGWRVILKDSLKNYYNFDPESFEYNTTVQLLRAGQSGASSRFKAILKENGVDVEDFEYHTDLLPHWAPDDKDYYDDRESFNLDIPELDKVPSKYENLIDY